MIVCGEPSGDLNASELAKKLLQINPQLKITGVGGALLKDVASQIYCDIKELACFGVFDVLKKLPRFLALQKLLLQKIRQDKPDALILVDFSGFNLRLAKKVNKVLPVIYYTSPQVWASRSGRVETIKKYVDKMLVFFKFEEEFYRKHGFKAEFVGSPLLDIVHPSTEKEIFLKEHGLLSSRTTIALLPGSRKSEVNNILPVMLKASSLLNRKIKDIQFVIAKSTQVDLKFYEEKMRGNDLLIEIVEGKTYDCLNSCDFALVASGTATLETAILEKPFLIIYKMGLLNYLLYSPQVKVPFIGIVNIISGRKIIPELVQFQATAKNIAAEAGEIITDRQRSNAMKESLVKVKSLLGDKGASSRAAKIILDYLKIK